MSVLGIAGVVQGGAGTADRAPDVAIRVPDSEGAAIVDIDEDGTLDIVTSQSTNGIVEWWEQGADRWTWTRHQIGSGFSKIEGIVAADFDDDGEIEVIALDQTLGTVTLFKPTTPGAPTGSWTSTTLVSSKPNAHSGQAIDIDGDGIPELVYTVEGSTGASGGVYWLDFDGADVTDAADWTDYTMVAHPGAWWLASSGRADLSGSGRGDIVFSARDERNSAPVRGIYWIEAPADPTDPWTEHTIESRSADWLHVDIGDFSGNGHGKDVIGYDTDNTYGPHWYDFSSSWAATAVTVTGDSPSGDRLWNMRRFTLPGATRDGFMVLGTSSLVVVDWTGAAWRSRSVWPTGYDHPADGDMNVVDIDATGGDELVFCDSGGDRVVIIPSPFDGVT